MIVRESVKWKPLSERSSLNRILRNQSLNMQIFIITRVLKSIIFWDIIPRSSLKVNWRFEGIMPPSWGWKNKRSKKRTWSRKHCSTPSCSFLVRLIFRTWKWRRYVSPKRRLTFSGLHSVISHNIVTLITTAVRTWNPTHMFWFRCIWFSLVLIVVPCWMPLECQYPEWDNAAKDQVWMLAGILLCRSFLCFCVEVSCVFPQATEIL
jgi:hypothetical protein